MAKSGPITVNMAKSGPITVNTGQYRPNTGQYWPIQAQYRSILAHTHTLAIPIPLAIPPPYPIPGYTTPCTQPLPQHVHGCTPLLRRPLAVHQASFGLNTKSHAGHLVAIFGMTCKSDKIRLHCNRVLQKCTVLDTFKTKPLFSTLFVTFAPNIE